MAGPYRYFATDITGDHLLLKSTAEATFQGGGSLMLRGWTITLASDQNTTVIDTHDEASATGTRVRWVVIAFDAGTVQLSGSAPLEVAARDAAQVRWQGEARFRATSGIVQGDDGTTYVANGREGILSGDLAGTLSPAASGTSAMSLDDVRGRIDEATLATRLPTPGPSRAAGGGWLLAGVALGAVLAGGGAVAWHRHRARGRETSLEEALELANAAAAAERWSDACSWTQRARALAPGSRRLQADHAFFLRMLGRYEEAFELGRDLCDDEREDGMVFFEVALSAALSGRPAGDVEDFLAHALELAPELEECAQEETRLHDALDALRSRWRR